jgi:DNA-binding winged helix-turn-helix (wHTH) protein
VRIQFDRFIIDSETRQLLSGGAETHLSTKAFDLLWTLVERRPNVVEKAELQRRIWAGTHVVDANLNVLIGEIRRALGDSPKDSKFVRTVHRVGFAFAGGACEVPEIRRTAVRELLCWVVWRGKTFPLSQGDNVIGRDPRCSVWLDAPGVSRRHATIRIDEANRRVSVQDLESTNGTFVQGSRVRSEVPLTDGDQFMVGPIPLTIRLWSSDTAGETRRIRRERA